MAVTVPRAGGVATRVYCEQRVRRERPCPTGHRTVIESLSGSKRTGRRSFNRVARGHDGGSRRPMLGDGGVGRFRGFIADVERVAARPPARIPGR